MKTTGKLTKAQIYTLRRMNSGTKYVLRGDGKKAYEQRPSIGVERGQWFNKVDPINAPSVPVLFRMELVEFVIDRGQEQNKLYCVKLTPKGHEAANTAKIEGEK